ncbi:CPBP family intramembrane glutamic endopeptidase [Macrococcus animalis]|uniref:CPBP family intramembrane glutamic endopeptidase n=1 Tax=Macrococcus animalis TaxID=3395467 RepID=UPI0039BEC6DE
MHFNHSIALSKKSPNNIPWFATILIAFAIFFIVQMLAGFIIIPILLAFNPSATMNDLMAEPLGTLIGLLMFPFLLAACLLINRYAYRHPIQALGFFKEKIISKYFLGLCLGILIIMIVYVINLVFGAMSSTLNASIPWVTITWLVALFMIQGLTEEVIARGFLMNKISYQIGVPAGIIINSAFFSFLHFLNPNTSILSFVNLFLAGIVFSLLFYWSDNIWLTGAAHSFWNITLGVFLGNEVSGQALPGTIFNSKSNMELSLVNGGKFGLEGGVIVTIVSLIVIAILLKLSIDKYGMKKRA